jgi:hypothetical protein
VSRYEPGSRGTRGSGPEDVTIEYVAILLIPVWVVAFTLAAEWVARRRRRSAAIWAVLGAITGPVALVLLGTAPPGRCPVCDTPTRGWTPRCSTCGADVRAAPVDPPIVAPNGYPSASSHPEAPAAATNGPGPTAVLRAAAVASAVRPIGDAPSMPPAPPPSTTERVSHVIATGVFISGIGVLRPGARYGLRIEDDALRVIGPVDEDPEASVLRYELDGLDARASGDRLILNGKAGRGQAMSVFMAVSGAGPDGAASEIERFRSAREQAARS